MLPSQNNKRIPCYNALNAFVICVELDEDSVFDSPYYSVTVIGEGRLNEETLDVPISVLENLLGEVTPTVVGTKVNGFNNVVPSIRNAREKPISLHVEDLIEQQVRAIYTNDTLTDIRPLGYLP